MKIINANYYGKINLITIENFEKKLGKILPKEYRDFLLEYNGGESLNTTFKILDIDIDDIKEFYNLTEGNNNNLAYINFDIYQNRLPEGLLVINEDDFGNLICIGVEENNYGEIFFWDHDKEGENNCYIHIYNSFSDFINNLYEYIDENESIIDKSIKDNNVQEIERIINDGYNIETLDEYDRSLLENAVIHAKKDIIELLHTRGALPRKSAAIAEENMQFFEEHKEILELLHKLYKQ